MIASPSFADKKTIAELTAKMLLEVEAVRFYSEKPFIFTSGLASPVYTDCRRLISFPRVRSALIDFGASTLARDVGFEAFDTVAGGETAGIPFAAWMADKLTLPMQYVRKQSKGFGRNAQIEGEVKDGQRVLLVEDMTTDGGSKVNFINALRTAGVKCDHTFVFFFYDIFPEGLKTLTDMGVTHHALATWWDVLAVAKKSEKFSPDKLAEVEAFMHDPRGWSKAHGGTAGFGLATGWLLRRMSSIAFRSSNDDSLIASVSSWSRIICSRTDCTCPDNSRLRASNSANSCFVRFTSLSNSAVRRSSCASSRWKFRLRVFSALYFSSSTTHPLSSELLPIMIATAIHFFDARSTMFGSSLSIRSSFDTSGRRGMRSRSPQPISSNSPEKCLE